MDGQKETAMSKAVKEKINQVIEKYLDVQLITLNRIEQGQPIEPDAIHAINDSIRILNHITKVAGVDTQSHDYAANLKGISNISMRHVNPFAARQPLSEQEQQ